MQTAPKPRQLAVKLASDPVGFDLAETLRIWGRAPTAILISEVLAAMPKLPTADDIRADLRHVSRHIELLRRQLVDKEQRQAELLAQLPPAEARERAIARAKE
jgi:hypothetical protein